MPKLKEEDLEKAIQYEAENHIPLPIDEVYLGSQIIPPLYNHLDHTDVLIVALPKKIIDSYVYCLKKAGLQPKVLELESSAVARALIKKEATSYNLALVDLGKVESSFIVFAGYSIRFTSDLPVYSQKFTEAIAGDLGINLEEAEKLKCSLGNKKDKNEKVLKAIAPLLTELTEEIKKRLNYYQTHSFHEHLPPGQRGIQRIILCGGGAVVGGIETFLTDQLKIPVSLGNPWTNILPEPQKEIAQLPYKESLRYTTALGLALRGIKEKND
jgi:type IV pilus assembly protein PilM